MTKRLSENLNQKKGARRDTLSTPTMNGPRGRASLPKVARKVKGGSFRFQASAGFSRLEEKEMAEIDEPEITRDTADDLYRESSFVNGSGYKIFTQAWVPPQPKYAVRNPTTHTLERSFCFVSLRFILVPVFVFSRQALLPPCSQAF